MEKILYLCFTKYCFFFGLQNIALLYLPSGLLTILIYFQPVVLSIFAWFWLGENMNFFKIAGLVIGFLGVTAISINSLIGSLPVKGIILGLLTAITWAAGVCYIKKTSFEVNSFWMIALQNVIGGSVLIAIAQLFENWKAIKWSAMYLLGLGYGSILGIPIAYIIYYNLINAGDASKISSFMFLVPIVSVIIGAIFLGENISFILLIGLLLVVLGIYFVNKRDRKLI